MSKGINDTKKKSKKTRKEQIKESEEKGGNENGKMERKGTKDTSLATK